MNIHSQFPQDSTKRVVINPVILNEYHSKILVPSIPVVNQNPLTVVVNGRKNFPMDNISSSRIITDYNLNKAKIYYPRNYTIKMLKLIDRISSLYLSFLIYIYTFIFF